jgi:hypothetical protein
MLDDVGNTLQRKYGIGQRAMLLIRLDGYLGLRHDEWAPETHRHIVVTGASSGIGWATALRLARILRGSQPRRRRCAEQSAHPGHAITPLLMDVTNAEQIGAAVESVAGHVGSAGLNALVDNTTPDDSFSLHIDLALAVGEPVTSSPGQCCFWSRRTESRRCGGPTAR